MARLFKGWFVGGLNKFWLYGTCFTQIKWKIKLRKGILWQGLTRSFIKYRLNDDIGLYVSIFFFFFKSFILLIWGNNLTSFNIRLQKFFCFVTTWWQSWLHNGDPKQWSTQDRFWIHLKLLTFYLGLLLFHRQVTYPNCCSKIKMWNKLYEVLFLQALNETV